MAGFVVAGVAALALGRLQNLTVYRLTPINVTGVENMDSGDAMGDLFFFTGDDFSNPYNCRRNPSGSKCANGTGHELFYKQTYRQMVIEVNTSKYGPYYECNPPPDGQWGNFTCRVDCDEECCKSYNWTFPCDVQGRESFGATRVADHEPSVARICPLPRLSPPKWQAYCWKAQMTALLGDGMYYSTQTPGKASGAWRLVETVKVTNATCNNRFIVESVKKKDTTGCFSGCPDPNDNKSDCVIECFYRTVLGHQTAGGSGSGLPAAFLLGAWNSSFASCPSIL